ncbi:MAG: SDR family NAD(P)-dependent oxidoreductase [Clostridia bacterium]|nr:SDR family NAD(P)-dependent oxidoreductase [Clostridia bacterium]
MRIAVFTGASSGMGREFVRRITGEEKFDEVWLIARRRERLEEIAAGVSAKTRILPLDLSDRAAIESYRQMLAKENPEIAVLVNAAGFGLFGTFEKMDLDAQLGIIELNDKALVGMTYASLPYMKAGSRIYQLGSLSSFQPVPYINVYGASKAFVLSFSRALNCELKHDGRGIRVMAVCPGWVKTEFFDHAVHDDTIKYYNRFYTPEQVVERALKDMKRGRDVSVCGVSVRSQVRLTKLLPHKTVMSIWCRQQKK